MTEKTYSAKDLSGKETDIDRSFSESEVDLFSDLFSEFWDENGDQYSDLGGTDAIDIAYSEFFDAYSSCNYSNKGKTLNENYGRAAIAGAGAVAGYGAAGILNAKDKNKRKEILLKMKQGRASSTEINELKSLKTKINTRKALSTVGGAALAYGGARLISKHKQKQNKKEMESNYSQEDLFADEFANYFVTNVDHYGDTDEGMDEAYNDFVGSMENETEEVYSEEQEMLMDNFSNFYNDVADLYSNDDEGMEDAFNDFLEIEASMDNYTEDAEIVEEEYSEEELAFIDYYTSNEDVYGDDTELAYNDFMEVYSEVENEFETEYSGYDDAAEETFYSEEVQEMAHDFADFYSELEDVYGDDLEMAFDDYSDALENLANEEDVYGDDSYAMPKFNRKSTMKNAGMGAAAGLGVGLIAGAATDPNSKERKALKDKVKAGTASAADKTRLQELKRSRRNRLMKAGGAGAVGGAAIGAGAGKVATAMKKRNVTKKLAERKTNQHNSKVEAGHLKMMNSRANPGADTKLTNSEKAAKDKRLKSSQMKAAAQANREGRELSKGEISMIGGTVGARAGRDASNKITEKMKRMNDNQKTIYGKLKKSDPKKAGEYISQFNDDDFSFVNETEMDRNFSEKDNATTTKSYVGNLINR